MRSRGSKITVARYVRWLAAFALLPIAGCSSDPVADSIAGLRSEDVQVRRAAAQRLIDLGDQAQPAASALNEALKDRDREVRRLAIHALGQVGASAESSLPALVAALDDSELSVRIAAAFAIQRVDAAEEGHQRVLIDAMKSGEGGIIVSVGEMEGDVAWAVPTLIDSLSDTRPGIRRITANALQQIGSAAAAAKPTLQRLAKSDQDERVRDAAQQALSAL